MAKEFERVCIAVEKLLETKGWFLAVSGPYRIERYPEWPSLKHQFVLEFVGDKVKKKTKMTGKRPSPRGRKA